MSSNWSEEFEAIIRRHSRFVEPLARIDPNALMASLGADSLEIVELIVDLEDEFGISFTEELLTPGVFATPMTIWRGVEVARRATQATGSAI